MSTTPLQHVLEATGYFPDGQAAPGLHLGESARRSRRGRYFSPDALWRSSAALTIYFKFEQVTPDDELVSKWRQEIWNEGFAPLLWVISPERIDLYNGFGFPIKSGDAKKHRLQAFRNIESSLTELDALAGRLSIETGQFWLRTSAIDRKTSVDQKLLSDLAHLEHDLVKSNLDRAAAQALIGRVIFTQYLIDRGIINAARLQKLCGYSTLSPILRDRVATGHLFSWLSETFNGDMFPPSSVTSTPQTGYLARVADFLEAVNPESGQSAFFPYQFDVIPVELISSIYEQFVHAKPSSGIQRSAEAPQHGVHYTRLAVVSLVLDEVMHDLTGKESVLDPTCGSGVFLVETLRRLVDIRVGKKEPTRELIRAILYEQVYGVDISEAAIRVAAFSLYLAALELDPDPQPPHALKFHPLIGKTLFVGDVHTVERTTDGQFGLTTRTGLKKFDLIVGNPPWSFKGRDGTELRRHIRVAGVPVQPRGEGLDFVLRAIEFSHEQTRFGIILSAMSFFSKSRTGVAAAQHVMQLLAPITLVNLSNLRGWLFATAKMPAVVLFARHRPQHADQVTMVQIPWSAGGAKTHTFEVSPSDIIKLPLADIERQPIKLKAAAVGRRRDLLLLDYMSVSYLSLGERLESLGAKLCDGLILGNQTCDAREMKGLELLKTDSIRRFYIPDDLPIFNLSKAERPRSRDIYRAPLLIIKEMLSESPRVVVAVAERDLVFMHGYFGASLSRTHRQAAHMLAGILSSSLASWFFLMASSEFGIWKTRLLIHDVALLPTPDLKQAAKSEAGKRLLRIEKRLQKYEISDEDWLALDEAVCDLYELDAADRIVVRDGLFRASWQWQAGRECSVSVADVQSHIADYAAIFLSVISGWLSARKKKRMRAEIFDLPQSATLRIVRFVLEEWSGDATDTTVEVIPPEGELNEILSRIGQRLNIKLATALSGQRELRVHGRNEVIIIKPAAQRYWMGVSALEDADAVVAESFTGGAA